MIELKDIFAKAPALEDEMIVYRGVTTMYYKKDWCFCITKNQYADLSKYKKLRVVINSKFKKGKLNIGELIIKGKSKKEILISTYLCHPSLANDNLSGVVMTSLLAKFLNSLKKLNWSYRIVFLPETIGAISYLHLKKEIIKKKIILGFEDLMVFHIKKLGTSLIF